MNGNELLRGARAIADFSGIGLTRVQLAIADGELRTKQVEHAGRLIVCATKAAVLDWMSEREARAAAERRAAKEERRAANRAAWAQRYTRKSTDPAT
jgi:hypothetical protein